MQLFCAIVAIIFPANFRAQKLSLIAFDQQVCLVAVLFPTASGSVSVLPMIAGNTFLLATKRNNTIKFK